MSSGGRRTTRNRQSKPSSSAHDADHAVPTLKSVRRAASWKSGDHSPIRLPNVGLWTLLGLGLAGVLLTAVVLYHHATVDGGEAERQARRAVTPLNAPKMMDLPQFQGEHKEGLYWGTYRPHVYLGIRARTPESLIAGLMWLGLKNGQYFVRHVCQDSDDLKTYGWLEHNGRDYGHQLLVDHGLTLTTSFLKSKGRDSGYGGDWAVRINADSENLDESRWEIVHLFFYVADEEGNVIDLDKINSKFSKKDRLAFGLRKDVGAWELHMVSLADLEIHYAGFRSNHMHNLTELLQGTLAMNARRTGQIQLPDTHEHMPNIIFFQVSAKIPFKTDIVFLSQTVPKSSTVEERIYNLTGTLLSAKLGEKGRAYEKDFDIHFSLKGKIATDSIAVGKAAIANLLGGMGYFYGQSKIALPQELTSKNGNNYVLYWPAELFTATPSRSYFPRGFLWDEGFHQMLIWRWDLDICLDILGHWLDLLNVDGWLPREQILGAEALSKVPAEFVLQYPTNGNPPTLFLVIRDILRGVENGSFNEFESIKISAFLERAFVRLHAWFQWFNATQSGKGVYNFYWHGRDNTTLRELNPKTLTSGLDDYPRASHPSEDERHLDLRCWMLLAADCLRSIAVLAGKEYAVEKEFHRMVEHLSNFEILNKVHLDVSSGGYFDFGNHTEKVLLKWHEVGVGEPPRRELVREVQADPQLSLVPHVGYVSFFPFMMGIIPPESWILGKQLELISNRSILWTDYGLRSLARTSSLYMKRNTEHDPPYWRGPIWINMNYMILSALSHYSKEDGPYRIQAKNIYKELRENLIRNVIRNYRETGFLWEQYDQKNKGKGKGTRPFSGWTALILLIMSESYPKL